jgi:hypothetical protein
MPVIRNDMDLQIALAAVVEQVINNVSDRVIQLLQDDIKKYAVNQTSDWYEPTNEFMNAFHWDDLKINLNNFSRTLFYDPSTMATYNPDRFIHGSNIGKWGDERPYLEEVLNVEGYVSSLHWKLSHPYWDIFISQVMDGGLLDQWFKIEFASAGLNIL